MGVLHRFYAAQLSSWMGIAGGICLMEHGLSSSPLAWGPSHMAQAGCVTLIITCLPPCALPLLQLAAVFKPLQAAVLHASQHRAAQALAALQQLDRRQWNTAQVRCGCQGVSSVWLLSSCILTTACVCPSSQCRMHGLILLPPHSQPHPPITPAPATDFRLQVQVLRGRVLYEGMQYKEAAAAFESARKLDPTCLEVRPHQWEPCHTL